MKCKSRRCKRLNKKQSVNSFFLSLLIYIFFPSYFFHSILTNSFRDNLLIHQWTFKSDFSKLIYLILRWLSRRHFFFFSPFRRKWISVLQKRRTLKFSKKFLKFTLRWFYTKEQVILLFVKGMEIHTVLFMDFIFSLLGVGC